jgi:hypothetical protein
MVWALAVCAACAVVAATSPARAAEGRTAVVVVEGGDNDAIAAAVGAHIEAPHTLHEARKFRASLAAHGFRTFAGAIGNKARDAQLVQRAHAAAREGNIDVAILVSIRKRKKDRLIHVWVIDAARDGAVADEDAPVSRTSSADDDASTVWRLASGLFPARAPSGPAHPAEADEKAAAPPPPAKEESTAAAVAENGPEADTGRQSAAEPENQPRGRTMLVVEAGGGTGTRRFTYTDRLTAQLRPYYLNAAPLVAADAEVYPLAGTKLPVLRGLGVVGSYARAVGLSSADSAGNKVGTSWQTFDVGLRERLRVSPVVLLGVDVRYGNNEFRFDTASLASAVLPSVEYQFVRAGLDARVAFGAFSIFGGGAYLNVLSTGQYLASAFPHETVGGVEGRVGVAYVFAKHFEGSLGVSYTRFFFSANPVPGNANVAGGMLDEMTRPSLMLAYMP